MKLIIAKIIAEKAAKRNDERLHSIEAKEFEIISKICRKQFASKEREKKEIMARQMYKASIKVEWT